MAETHPRKISPEFEFAALEVKKLNAPPSVSQQLKVCAPVRKFLLLSDVFVLSSMGCTRSLVDTISKTHPPLLGLGALGRLVSVIA
jgi:hypothetical protein